MRPRPEQLGYQLRSAVLRLERGDAVVDALVVDLCNSRGVAQLGWTGFQHRVTFSAFSHPTWRMRSSASAMDISKGKR